MPEVHARLSASGSAKWLNCPGSIAMEEQFKDESSTYAEEGTKAHALGELKINLALGNITRNKYTREVKKLGDIPADMEDYIEGYKDYVIEQYNTRKAGNKSVSIAVEKRLDFSDYVPGGFGTGDVVIAYEGGIQIIDLKYGKGVPVSAEMNSQLRLYGLGACNEYDYIYDIGILIYTIYQPRLDNISTYIETADSLIRWGEDTVKAAAEKATSEDAECIPGEYCDSHFCKARAVCRAYNNKRMELAKYDFIKPNKLTNEEIADVLEMAPKIQSWCEIVQAYVIDRVLHGEKFPGYKLVEGRSNRKYSDEDAVISALFESGYDIDDYMDRKLKSITKMTEFLGVDKFNELLGKFVIKPQGKPTLVPETDKRSEMGSAASAARDFGVDADV